MEDKRLQEIKKLRTYGWSWLAVGNYFGISRARAHQIGSGYMAHKIKNYKTEILNRDNHMCQWREKCNGDSSNLIIHHLDGNDRNNERSNLITLCRACHQYFHMNKELHSENPVYATKTSNHRVSSKVIERKCRGCSKLMLLTSSLKSREYCSNKCKNNKWNRTCAGCGKRYIVRKTVRASYYRDHSKFNKKTYCSRDCFNHR